LGPGLSLLRSINQYQISFSSCLKGGEAMTTVGYAWVSSLGQDLTVHRALGGATQAA